MPENIDKKVVIIGGGPAGLTAAYELCKAGIKSVVLEKDQLVGGLARTVNYRGYHFDIGGHRFFTKVGAVDKLWHEVLPNGDFLKRRRLSRIYFNKQFFQYPLHIPSALYKLGLWNTTRIALSYLRAKLFPILPAETFEEYITNHFGRRLYETFFKTYTEKVWGIPCREISAEWAAQRIPGLSLRTFLKNAFRAQPATGQNGAIKTLTDSFNYPKRGPGMMWETVARIVSEKGQQVLLQSEVRRIYWSNDRVASVEICRDGQVENIPGTHFISSMPLREMIQKFQPAAPAEVLQAAQNLNYRDFITVALIINKKEVFPDNWIYLHEPDVKLGRIQNFKNWSPEMVPDPNKTCLGLEYFCFEGDGLWNMTEQELIALGTRELVQLGLIHASDVVDGAVIKMPKAYPTYDAGYRESLALIRRFLVGIANLQTVGRNGMHKYNNQDHSMLTAMLAVKNILGGNYDLWAVNADQEYHEEISHNYVSKDEFRDLVLMQPLIPERRS